jgi:competence protein ComEC
MPVDIWFVNVGHGDSTIVRFPSGHVMVVDINNSKTLDTETEKELCAAQGIDHMVYLLGKATRRYNALRDYEALLEDPIDVLKRECPGEDVFRFIATHPDMDHLSGLYRLSQQEPIGIINFWDTANTKQMAIADFDKTRYDYRDWQAYQRLRRTTTDPKVLRLYRGAKGEYYTNDGIFVLSPTPQIVQDANEREDWNHLSYALKIVHGSASIILPGDASIAAQKEMAEVYGDTLEASILKAPHHGRESCYCEEFASAVSADYTVVSVGKKPDNDASNKYKKHSKAVFSTRFHGTIHARLHADGRVEVSNHKHERIDSESDALSTLLASIMR